MAAAAHSFDLQMPKDNSKEEEEVPMTQPDSEEEEEPKEKEPEALEPDVLCCTKYQKQK